MIRCFKMWILFRVWYFYIVWKVLHSQISGIIQQNRSIAVGKINVDPFVVSSYKNFVPNMPEGAQKWKIQNIYRVTSR